MKIYRVTTSNGHYEFLSLDEAQSFIATSEETELVLGEIDRPEPEPEVFEQLFTAEEWLAAQGYSSIRLVALLDLEGKLAKAGGVSVKLASVRTWIDGVLASFIQNPAPNSSWPAAPFTFEETTQEAWQAL